MSNDAPNEVNFLLVDDREANLIALERLLKRKGLNLLKAHSGSEALELLLKHDVALALVDVQMPEMDGFELAELMRGSDRTRRVPIVFVTAGATDQQRRFRGYETGAVDFLQKPIENDVLKSKASVFFDLYSERQEVARQRDSLEKINSENARLLEDSRNFAAALQQADQRKDEFLATLAHELRNPLSPILSGIELLGMLDKSKDRADATVEIREMIERQVHHMVRLVDDLLEVSRITSGKINLQPARIKMADVAKQAIETSLPSIEANKHKLAVNIPDEDLTVIGDMTRLTQVISNLLNNAARYTNEGGEITLSLTSNGGMAYVHVKDNGIGIPLEMQKKVFDLFTQIKHKQQNLQSGLGIGLALVRRIIDLHGGTTSVSSQGENHGSEFTIGLPLIAAEQANQSSIGNATTEKFCKRKILAVDDNTDALHSLKGLLLAMGHDVVVAENGSDGLKIFAAFEPQCVFLDIGMPEMDGYEVARHIRELPGGKDVLLFALTGWGQQEDRVRTANAGFDYHLVKPVTKVAIEAVLNLNVD